MMMMMMLMILSDVGCEKMFNVKMSRCRGMHGLVGCAWRA